jgi:hypothetical protein
MTHTATPPAANPFPTAAAVKPATAPASAPADPPTTEAKGGYTDSAGNLIPAIVDPLLVTILSWPRKHGSIEEADFKNYLTAKLISLGAEPKTHAEGAISVTLPPANGKASTTLFSCHIDTVDNVMSDPKTRKSLAYDPSFGHIMLEKESPGSCLGADDGAGIFIMLKMIEAKVPGTYLFHRGEECGGISSKAIAKNESGWLKQFDCAVAFDRHQDYEVLTHQGGQRCASDKFGLRLAERLSVFGMAYKTSDRGVYTDTKEYRKIISECVNVAVGYRGQHGRTEEQDYSHLVTLVQACIALEWDMLPIDRDPSTPDPIPSYSGKGFKGFYPGTSLHDDDDDGDLFGAKPKKAKGSVTSLAGKKPTQAAPMPSALEEATGMTLEDWQYMIDEDPGSVLELVTALVRENGRLRGEIEALSQLMGL